MISGTALYPDRNYSQRKLDSFFSYIPVSNGAMARDYILNDAEAGLAQPLHSHPNELISSRLSQTRLTCGAVGPSRVTDRPHPIIHIFYLYSFLFAIRL